jgi:hypothetical protein
MASAAGPASNRSIRRRDVRPAGDGGAIGSTSVQYVIGHTTL